MASKRPHKNQELLVRALPAALPGDAVLVLAGHAEPYDPSCARSRPSSAWRSACASLDYVPDAEIEALWGHGGLAAFPTRGEGFGLPMVEALHARRARRVLGHPGPARDRW